jgi:histidinol-phosphate/aromatic aminotransferase/cobyric acid decarboxylase-like protein
MASAGGGTGTIIEIPDPMLGGGGGDLHATTLHASIWEQLLLHPRALLVLGSPNNPTGRTYSHDVVERWATEFPQATFLLDQVYADYASLAAPTRDAAALASGLHTTLLLDNVYTVRSLSKAFGLADLRIAYIVSTAANIERLSVRFNHKNVTGLMKHAIVTVLSAEHRLYYGYMARNMYMLKRLLLEQCRLAGYTCTDTPCNFVCLHTATEDAADALVEYLLQTASIRVRKAPHLHPPTLRVTIGTPLENQALIAALKAWRSPLAA